MSANARENAAPQSLQRGARSAEAAADVPPLVITSGDPAGVGPELVAKLARNPSLPPFAWIGDPRHLPQGTAWAAITRPIEACALPKGILPVISLPFARLAEPGRPDPAHAPGIIAAIERAVALAKVGEAAGVVTAPLAKAVVKAGADFAFPGHTEFLAALAGVERVAMMLAAPELEPPLRVVPATVHLPLAAVPEALTPVVFEAVLRLTVAALVDDFGLPAPRVAVAGLNPHAGEGGLFGREEIEVMAPVLARLRAEGFSVFGPLPADTMFHEQARTGYDAAVCAYHDQALIPIKTLAFHSAVNITLGLPFVRTSPDHGTAFDIAGRGLARADSFAHALRLAWALAQRRAAAKRREGRQEQTLGGKASDRPEEPPERTVEQKTRASA